MAARVVVACMRCMRRVVVSTLVVRRVRVVALCGAADFLVARPPARACVPRVLQLRAAMASSAAHRASCALGLGRCLRFTIVVHDGQLRS